MGAGYFWTGVLLVALVPPAWGTPDADGDFALRDQVIQAFGGSLTSPAWSPDPGLADQIVAHLQRENASAVPYQVGAPTGRPADFPFAVALVETIFEIDPWGELTGVFPQSLCSGALIASTLVLTAGHCVTGGVYTVGFLGWTWVHTYLVVQGVSDVRPLFHFGLLPGSWQLSLAVVATPAPGYAGGTVEHDVGLALLDESLPLDLLSYPLVEGLQVPLLGNPGELAVRAPLLLPSYGSSTGPGQDMVGRFQVGRYDVLPGIECLETYALQVTPEYLLCTTGRRPVVDFCGGDSGGPFVQHRFGRVVIVAVVSGGSDMCHIGSPGLGARVGPILRDALGHTAAAGSLAGPLDLDAILANGEVVSLEASLMGSSIFVPTGPVQLASRTGSVWRAGAGFGNVAVRTSAEGLTIDARAVAPGEPALLEILTVSSGVESVQYFEVLLASRQPQVMIELGRDSRGALALMGSMVDQSGDPIARHRFSIVIPGARTTTLRGTTGADGSFSLPLRNMAPGDYAGTIDVPANARALIGALQEPIAFTIVGRDPQVSIGVGSDRRGAPALVGTIVDQDGDPLQRLRFTITIPGPRTTTLRGTTAQDGSFSLPLRGFKPGDYAGTLAIPANVPNLVNAHEEPISFTITARVPRAEVSLGSDARGGPALAGTVVDQDDRPMPGLRFTIAIPGDRPMTLRGTTSADGSFIVPLRNVRPGDYIGTLDIPANVPNLVNAHQESIAFAIVGRAPHATIDVGTDARGAPALVGVVVDQDDRPIQRLRFTITVPGDRPMVLRGSTGADGSFIVPLRNVRSGDYAGTLDILENVRDLIHAYEQPVSFSVFDP